MWQCPNCSETIEKQFDVCWNCGSDRTGAVDPNFLDEPDTAVPYGETVPLGVVPAGKPAGDPLGTLARRWFWSRGHWFFALATMGLLWLAVAPFGMDLSETYHEVVFFGIGIALFIPGAIRRGSAKQVIAMSVLSALTSVVADWAIAPFVGHDRFLLWYVLWPVAMIVLVGIGEWLIAPGGSLRSLAWIAGTCLTAAVGFAALFFVVRSMRGTDSITHGVSLALLAIVTWIVVPAGFKLADTERRSTQFAAVGGAVNAMAFGVLMFTSGIYWLAQTSLLGYGPYTQQYGSVLLDYRGRESDYEFILDSLRRADWSEPFSAIDRDDWRTTGVQLLIRHDKDWAATRLAGLLVDQPSRPLIDMTDGLFVEKRRYETVPVYMRYALTDSRQLSYLALTEPSRYSAALQELEVPEVMHAWLTKAAYTAVISELLRARDEGREPAVNAQKVLVSDDLRQRLAERLGEDVGPYFTDWEILYEARIESLPTPLSESQRDELQRVIRADKQYASALKEWHDFADQAQRTGIEPAKPDWDVPTTSAFEAEIQRFVHEVTIAAEQPPQASTEP